MSTQPLLRNSFAISPKMIYPPSISFSHHTKPWQKKESFTADWQSKQGVPEEKHIFKWSCLSVGRSKFFHTHINLKDHYLPSQSSEPLICQKSNCCRIWLSTCNKSVRGYKFGVMRDDDVKMALSKSMLKMSHQLKRSEKWWRLYCFLSAYDSNFAVDSHKVNKSFWQDWLEIIQLILLIHMIQGGLSSHIRQSKFAKRFWSRSCSSHGSCQSCLARSLGKAWL